MGTYEKKVNQLKDLMVRKYKSAYNKSKEMDIDISSMTYLPEPDAFNVINIEKMHIILDKVNKIIDDNKDKLKNPTCATCIHLHDQEWAKRYGKVCCSIWQVCDHYVNPNSKYNRKQKTYVRRPSNKACPNYEYGDDKVIIYQFTPVHFDASRPRPTPATPRPLPGSPPVTYLIGLEDSVFLTQISLYF